MNITTYKSSGTWQGTLKEGQGNLAFGPIETQYSVPQDLAGKGIGTNPEELIASAGSSCFLITLGAIFQFKNVSYKRLQVNSEVDFEVTQMGPKMRAIRYHVKVFVKDNGGEPADIKSYIRDAEKSCMLSSALSENVLVSTSGTIIQE
jgi:peroxiredoxin-like protein